MKEAIDNHCADVAEHMLQTEKPFDGKLFNEYLYQCIYFLKLSGYKLKTGEHQAMLENAVDFEFQEAKDYYTNRDKN